MIDPTRTTQLAQVPQLHGSRGMGRRWQGLLTLGVVAAVVLADQVTKWWGWRHVTGAIVNPGGTWFLGETVSAWYSGQLEGAVLDVLSLQVLTLGAFALLRRPRRLLVLVSASLMIAGWGSNLLDRLGLHLVTAPGFERGAVDFLPLGRDRYNLADVCITGGTVIFLVAVCRRRARTSQRAAASRPVAQPEGLRGWVSAWKWAAVAAVVPILVAGVATLLTVPRTS
jgi:lipoprotein signal peptidase